MYIRPCLQGKGDWDDFSLIHLAQPLVSSLGRWDTCFDSESALQQEITIDVSHHTAEAVAYAYPHLCMEDAT